MSDKLFSLMIIGIITLSVTAIFIAIFIDFYLYEKKDNVTKKKRSIVATGTMIGFYFVYYLLIRQGIGRIVPQNIQIYKILCIIGTVMIVAGAFINITGRTQLKSNWANHIKIYDNHTLVTKGAYGYVRHPLYASIMLALYGGCIVYLNWLCTILVSIVFIPFMYYRAKQEEKLLSEQFTEYNNYRDKIGMFFPKSFRRYRNETN